MKPIYPIIYLTAAFTAEICEGSVLITHNPTKDTASFEAAEAGDLNPITPEILSKIGLAAAKVCKAYDITGDQFQPAFTAFKLEGRNFLAIPAKRGEEGHVHIIDEEGISYGPFTALSQFKELVEAQDDYFSAPLNEPWETSLLILDHSDNLIYQ
jgi:hypothetical protein